MGLFRTIGRQVEEVKQKVTGNDDATVTSDTTTGEATDADHGTGTTDATDVPTGTQSGDTEASENNYVCDSCGEQFATQKDECPACWTDAVSPISEA